MSNTSVRIIVSLIAIPLILLICYLGGIYFLLFVLGIGVVGFYEFYKLTLHKHSKMNITIGTLSVIALILNNYIHYTGLDVLLLFIVLTVITHELFRERESAIYNTATALLGILYIGFFASQLINIREYFTETNLYAQGGYLIIAILITIWVCDSAAFFVGKAIGKKKLLERISPNKSWEGAIAGFVTAIAAMAMAKIVILSFLNWIDAIILGMIIGSLGQIGDLVESMFKRDAKVKDTSDLIPGHGGVLDRFDSLLFTSPLIYLYLHFFVN